VSTNATPQIKKTRLQNKINVLNVATLQVKKLISERQSQNRRIASVRDSLAENCRAQQAQGGRDPRWGQLVVALDSCCDDTGAPLAPAPTKTATRAAEVAGNGGELLDFGGVYGMAAGDEDDELSVLSGMDASFPSVPLHAAAAGTAGFGFSIENPYAHEMREKRRPSTTQASTVALGAAADRSSSRRDGSIFDAYAEASSAYKRCLLSCSCSVFRFHFSFFLSSFFLCNVATIEQDIVA
jgi:hypothetical protein